MTIFEERRNQEWQNGVLVFDEVVQVDVTAPAIEFELHGKARTALAGNEAALGLVTTGRNACATAVTNADTIIATAGGSTAAVNGKVNATAQEVKRLANVLDADLVQTGRALRQASALIRLLIGDDLLVENSDT